MNILKLLFNSTAVWGLILGFCFVILYYINYKNKYVLGLDKKEIIKKYKKLIITITCSPLIVFVLAFFDISRYADYFIYPNFILIFVMLLFILFNKKLSFYDTSIYIYIYIYIFITAISFNIYGPIPKNIENSGFLTSIIFLTASLFFVIIQSVIYIVIINYQQYIRHKK